MAEHHKTKRSLSVNQRLMSLGVAAFAGFGAMIAVGWYQNAQLAAALVDQQHIDNQVADLNNLRVANLEMVLAAMDSIVDRDAGKVAPERLDLMRKALERMKASEALVGELAAMSTAPDAAKTFLADIAGLQQAMLTTLPKLVETGAPTDDFAQIDDAIDGGGERIAELFALLAKDGKAHADGAVLEAQRLSTSSLYWQFGLGLFGLVLMGILYPMHSSAIRRGVYGIRDSLERLLREDFDTPVDGRDRGDEFGTMAVATESLRLSSLEKRTMSETARLDRERNDVERAAREAARLEDETQVRFAVDALANGLAHLADGDMTIVLDQAFRSDLERVRGDFNRAVEKLQSVISEVKSTSASIEANSNQMRSAADDLSRRTEQQAASLEETSAALAEITATVQNTSVQAEDAAQMVDGTKANAEQSGRVVSEAMAAMQRIETASNEIGKIINVVDEIAFQTNLLALNAGVEAARAGDAGKGFAVVAQEVRELAGRAAGAAKDIKLLVGRSNDEVRSGVQLVTATGDALGHIAEDVARINEIVRSIATASQEQSTGIREISTAINQMDQMTQQNAAMVEQTNAASHTLAQDTGTLTRLVSQFQIHGVAVAARRQPQPVSETVRPKPSPARNLVNKLAGAFTSKPAPKAVANGSDNNWEEF